VSRESELSLYRTDLSSFTMGDSYDQKDAAGFIRILGLPSRSRAIKTQAKRSTMEAPKTLQGKEEVAQ
jgi:argininosuccinate synthase